MERVVSNIRMYLDVLRPRSFEANDLTSEIPSDLAYYFCYNQYEVNASEVGKLLVKDIRGVSGEWSSLVQAQKNLTFLFTLLMGHLVLNKTLPGVQTLSSQVFTGKVKKGMPGFSEFGTQIDVQISSIINPLLEIITMRQ